MGFKPKAAPEKGNESSRDGPLSKRFKREEYPEPVNESMRAWAEQTMQVLKDTEWQLIGYEASLVDGSQADHSRPIFRCGCCGSTRTLTKPSGHKRECALAKQIERCGAQNKVCTAEHDLLG
jgi:hypothetical protein